MDTMTLATRGTISSIETGERKNVKSNTYSRYANDYTILPTYSGSKAKMYSKYSALYDRNKLKYIEPFVGSGGMFFNLPNGNYEEILLNDKNINLMTIYQCLRDDDLRGEFLKRLNMVEIPEEEEEAKLYFEALRKTIHWYDRRLDQKEDILNVAIDTYVLYAISKNGNADEYSHKMGMKFKIDIKRRMPNVMESLDVKPKFSTMDCLKLIERHKDDSSVQWFIDSPYVGIYRTNKPLYRNELITLEQHVRLAHAVSKIKGAVVMCGYRSKIKGVPTIYDAVLGRKFKCYLICEKPNGAVRVKKGQKRPMCKEYAWTNHTPKYAGMYISLDDYREDISVSEYWDIIMEKIQKEIIPKNQINEYKSAFNTCIELELIPANIIWKIN